MFRDKFPLIITPFSRTAPAHQVGDESDEDGDDGNDHNPQADYRGQERKNKMLLNPPTLRCLIVKLNGGELHTR